jgi:SAM-dependent methyltransferase
MTGGHVGEWDAYWKSRSLKRALIEAIREVYFARVFTREVISLARPGTRVLEVGSGSGTYLRRLERLGYRVHGIDLSPEAIRYSRARGTPCVFLGDIYTLPFHDKSFEVAYNQGVMEHFDDREFRVILREMKRVAYRVAVIVPSALSVFRFYDPFGDDPHKRFFNRPGLRALFVEELTHVQVKYLWASGFLSIVATGQA